MKLNFVTVVCFINCWSKEMVSVQFCKEELGMNHDTTVDWCSFMREVCVDSLERAESRKIGGPKTIVEVDESLLTKRKNNSGRVLPQVWIFGGLCRETSESFLVTVPDRKIETLTQVIKERIAEGSTIFSDSWRSYKTSELEAQGFQHFKVNHKYNFVDPESGAHTQTIGRMWGSAKWRNKKHRGTARNMLDSYLAEFMWQNVQKEKDIFLQILHAIAIFCPPEINIKST
uniref:DDE_Tnp_IS1595 domain-containing protein n=1 Tax=Strongyloides stercoralis TaxID=6248 RepID=A0A0K0ETC7_STRER